jgi:predicted TIM-barrel fold metal-dependent hydrolase
MAAAMDAAGVDVQALSLTAPGVEQLEVEEAKTFARETNAAIAEALRRHPTRFFGLAALPVGDPPAAMASSSAWSASMGSKESSSMVTIAAAISMTASSGRCLRKGKR